MHNNIKPIALCLLENEFIKSLDELKVYLDFNLLVSADISKDIESLDYQVIIIQSNMLDSKEINLINNIKDKGKLFVYNAKDNSNINSDDKIELPLNVLDLNYKIKEVIVKKKFIQNSAIKIKNYILDKNEKKLKKGNLSIIITDKEVQLLELLFSDNKPLSKKKILEIIWNYSPDADTHTVETHIYRLRNKILEKFNDKDLIINDTNGYCI